MFRAIFFLGQTKDSMKFSRRVLAITLMLVMAGSSLTPFVQAPVLAADAPEPLTPSDGIVVTATGYNGSEADPPSALPVFSWTAVGGAKSYRLQFSQDIAFTTKIEVTTSLNRYIPLMVDSFPDGLWYWRVRVETPAPVSAYSTTMSFTKMWASPDNKPILNSPINDEKLDFYDSPIFSWQPVIGAALYKFQISSDVSFGSTNIKEDKPTLATMYQPLAKLDNGQYYWRVIPLDSANHSGTPSEIRSFTLAYGLVTDYPDEIPTLIEPLDKYDPDYVAPTFTPTFRWTAVRGVTKYTLQYTTDPTCNFGIAGYTTTIDTTNTVYTPTVAFPNDVNYCWHVRAVSGKSISDWSETWEFLKKWYIQAVPLTPVNNYQYTKYPFFSWTPVPAAASYKIEVCEVNSFNPCPKDGFVANAVNPYYVRPDFDWAKSDTGTWYWRVTPLDGSNNSGKSSDGQPYPRQASFVENYDSFAPNLISPLYYYHPNQFLPPDESIRMSPSEDRTTSLPIFQWNHVFDMSGVEANAYRIQVDDDPTFSSPNWVFDTENNRAVPTADIPFSAQGDTDYYWHVCTLNTYDGGSCISPWSQVWKTRIDISKGLSKTSTITLLRPLNGSESVEATPLLEWFPLDGANSYHVQISQDPYFNSMIDDVIVPYPSYAPQESLAQRNLHMLNYGTYYWRVLGLYNSSSVGGWSSPWRFQVASQSQWRRTRTIGNTENRLVVANDPVADSVGTYELTNLYSSEDTDNWYFGFDVAGGADMAYGLYLDTDHIDGSGATNDARAYNIETISAHKPEFAIYFLKRGGNIGAHDVLIYRWDYTQWANPPTFLDEVGGAIYYDGSYVEIRVPMTAIGMGEETNSISLSLFSIDEVSKNIQDTVPQSTDYSILDRFTSVSERLNIILPPTNASSDPTEFSSVMPFFFDYPSDTPWEGYNLQISLDPKFTTDVRDYNLTANVPYYSPPMYVEQTKVQDIQGDNTYYWRIRPQYFAESNIAGAWSEAGRFNRQGFLPINLQVSVTFATPSFSWDIVEGTKNYEIQIDDDPNFGSPINGSTTQTNFTLRDTLANGTYFWRVRVVRDTITGNDWSPIEQFTLALPYPTGLAPNDPLEQNVIGTTPTLCWDKLIRVDGEGIPVLSAAKYVVQVSKGDPNFSSITETATTEQSCWTSQKGYVDGKYYWRVAMIDGGGKYSEYSPAAEFTKQYPIAKPKSPANGSASNETPTFTWTDSTGTKPYVFGAAAYKVEISTSPTFATLYDSATTDNSTFIPTKMYATGQTYYWRIAIVDADGKVGPFTDARIILDPNASKERIYLPFTGR